MVTTIANSACSTRSMGSIFNGNYLIYVHATTQMVQTDTSTSRTIRPQPYNLLCTINTT